MTASRPRAVPHDADSSDPVSMARDRPTLFCPLCGPGDAGRYRLAARIRSRSGQPYRIFRCRAHGVEFADNGHGSAGGGAPKVVLDQLYGPLQEEISARYVDFVDRVERTAGERGRLHDVGCGNGQLLLEAQRRGWAVQGNDMLDAVRPALEARGISYFEGELAALALPARSCDIVTSFCVLPHHVADPVPDLRAAAQLLRPGGWFIAELPSDGLYRRLAWALYRLTGGRVQMPLANIYEPLGHVFGYSPASIRLLLEQCGFDRVTVEPYVQPASMSTARFAGRGLAFRTVATLGVGVLAAAARIVRLPNHMLVAARMPRTDVTDLRRGSPSDRSEAGLARG